ncbi:MAG: hypothetical protein ACO1N0_04780 [Fluviicola sp.]
MRSLKITILSLFAILAFQLTAQNSEPLMQLPKKKEFKASEPNFIASVDWIENTAFDEEPEMHKHQYAMIVGWMSDSPTITITLNGYVLDYTKVNKELLAFFMGGWGKYALEHHYSTDELECNLAGLRSMIRIYKTGKLKSDDAMQKLVDLEEKGELEELVKEKIKKK